MAKGLLVNLNRKEESDKCFRTCMTAGFLRTATRLACEALPDDTAKLEELAMACDDSATCRHIVQKELQSWKHPSLAREPWLFRLTMRRLSERGPEAHELLQQHPWMLLMSSYDLNACSFRREVRDCHAFLSYEEKRDDLFRASSWMSAFGRRHALRNLVGGQSPKVVGWYLSNVYPNWRDISIESTGTKNFLHAIFEFRNRKWILGVIREMLHLSPPQAQLRESDFSVWTTAYRVPTDGGYAQRVLVNGARALVECKTEEAMEKRIRWAAHGNCYEEHVMETLRGAPGPEDYSVAPGAAECRPLTYWREARSMVKEHYRSKRMARLLAWRKLKRGDRAIRIPFLR